MMKVVLYRRPAGSGEGGKVSWLDLFYSENVGECDDEMD